MKKFFSLLLFLLPIVSFAENETRKITTKYEKLESETGSIMKYIDYKTQKLSTAGLTLNIKTKRKTGQNWSLRSWSLRSFSFRDAISVPL